MREAQAEAEGEPPAPEEPELDEDTLLIGAAGVRVKTYEGLRAEAKKWNAEAVRSLVNAALEEADKVRFMGTDGRYRQVPNLPQDLLARILEAGVYMLKAKNHKDQNYERAALMPMLRAVMQGPEGGKKGGIGRAGD